MRKIIYSFAFATIMILFSLALVSAGGWAVITLDRLPSQVIVKEPVAIGFMVRQHGRAPANGLSPTIQAAKTGSAESFTVMAEPDEVAGHYTANMTFPSAGSWEWTIDAFSFPQPMPRLTVLAAAPAKAPPVSQTSSNTVPVLPLVVGVVVAIGAAGALVYWLGTRRRLGLALLVIAAAIGVVGFAFAANQAPTAETKTAMPDTSAQTEQVELGKGLFVAKGCIVCHQNNAAHELAGNFRSLSVGPDLSSPKWTTEFLHRWLKDPSAVKPGTEMPTLGLSDVEIAALAAFLTAAK
ncbi:MAG: c-type cytochrome [Chloroflexi bacterium]|nr:c-type cytochrome [Chloroflexota bacterium]